jgi:hypothetical protein
VYRRFRFSLTYLLLWESLTAAQDRVRDALAAGAVSGTVLDGATTQPVSGASVRLLSQHDGPNRSYDTSTRENGSFEFRDVEHGRYLVEVSATDYVRERVDTAPMRVEITPRSPRARLDPIALWRASSLEGRILDRYRQPVSGAIVKLLVARYFRGRKVLAAAGQTAANDKGEFLVGNLPAGSYFAVAHSYSRPIASKGVVYSPTFHPWTTSPLAAIAISVAPGSARSGVEITLVESPAFRVHGVVLDADTKMPLGRVPLTVEPDDWRAYFLKLRDSNAVTGADGSYRVGDLIPGRYRISVGGPGMPAGTPPHEFEISRGDERLDILAPRRDAWAASVAGRVSFGDAPPDGRPNVRVALEPCRFEQGIMPTRMPNGWPSSDGAYRIESVRPGCYIARLLNMSDGWFLKRASLSDSPSARFTLQASQALGLDFTISHRAALVTGAVTNDGGDPLSGVPVIARGDRVGPEVVSGRSVTAADGTFQFYLPPGAYRLVACAGLPLGLEEAVASAPWADRYGTAVALEESGKALVRLKAAPAQCRADAVGLVMSLSDLL